MVVVAQLVRAIDCGSIGRGFKPHLPPSKDQGFRKTEGLFLFQLTLKFGDVLIQICV
jgi:hypothetical protein